jgi:hypothetical protein
LGSEVSFWNPTDGFSGWSFLISILYSFLQSS